MLRIKKLDHGFDFYAPQVMECETVKFFLHGLQFRIRREKK